MKDKLTEKSEKLAEILLQADDDILEEAEKTNSATKFLKLNGAKKKADKKTKLQKWKILIPIAAILAVTVLVLAIVPALQHTEDIPENLPWVEKTAELSASIHNLSEFHFRAAMKILQESKGQNTLCLPNNTVQNLRSLAVRPAVLANGKYNSGESMGKQEDEKGQDKYGSAEEEDPKQIYYYEVGLDEVFTIKKVWFFQIKVSNSKSFLGGKVGTGVIDVVVTENYLFEDMITFRNGPYYYSCLLNDGSSNSMGFSTHKYVDGFAICKNFEKQNYSFEVIFDRHDKVKQIQMYEGVGTSGTHPLDEALPLVGESYSVSCNRSFTIADLGTVASSSTLIFEEDVSSSSLPDGNFPPVQIQYYVSNEYVLELRSDNTFRYYAINMEYSDFMHFDPTVYQQGQYTQNEEGITFYLYADGKIADVSEAVFLENGNLLYKNSEFQPKS